VVAAEAVFAPVALRFAAAEVVARLVVAAGFVPVAVHWVVVEAAPTLAPRPTHKIAL
jgi:hypothetical protein